MILQDRSTSVCFAFCENLKMVQSGETQKTHLVVLTDPWMILKTLATISTLISSCFLGNMGEYDHYPHAKNRAS